jgi:hypothetical protein
VEQARIDLHDGPTMIEDDDERDRALEPLTDQTVEIATIIRETPARTLEGVRAKARNFVLCSEFLKKEGYTFDEEFIALILRDLLEGSVVA